MRNMIFAIALVLCASLGARAQVEVEVLPGNDQFIPGEQIPVRVRVVNRSGQTLHFGGEQWVTFAVESKDGLVVEQLTGEPALAHDFDVQASEMATTKAVDITPFFKIDRSGRYTVTATVHIAAWGKEYVSKPKFFDLVRGNKIWEQNFGVPQGTNSTAEPEVRKYVLQQASMLNRLSLYAKICDSSEERTYKVVSLGTMISFSNPQPQMDAMNNLHLLYQEASQRYRYVIINVDGDMVVRQTYLYAESNPHLKADDAGNISLQGGVRMLAENDIPPNPSVKKPNASPATQP